MKIVWLLFSLALRSDRVTYCMNEYTDIQQKQSNKLQNCIDFFVTSQNLITCATKQNDLVLLLPLHCLSVRHCVGVTSMYGRV